MGTNRIEIEYCTGCRWLLRAAWSAQELLGTFEQDLTEVLAELRARSLEDSSEVLIPIRELTALLDEVRAKRVPGLYMYLSLHSSGGLSRLADMPDLELP